MNINSHFYCLSLICLSLFIKFNWFCNNREDIKLDSDFLKSIKNTLENKFTFNNEPPGLNFLASVFLRKFIKDYEVKYNVEDFIILKPIKIIKNILILLSTLVIFIVYKILCKLSDAKLAFLMSTLFLLNTSKVLNFSLLSFDLIVLFLHLTSIFYFLKYLQNENFKDVLLAGIFLSMLIVSSRYAIYTFLPILIKSLINLIKIAANKKRPLITGNNSLIYAFLKTIFSLLILPSLFYIFTFTYFFNNQKNFSDDATTFSLRFQGQLKNNLLEVSDQYLIDRSIITLINKENKVYLKSENKNYQKGSEQQVVFAEDYKDENSIWKVIKIHIDNDNEKVTDADRNFFVMDGDYVKFVHVLTDKYLHSHNIESENSSNKKLKEVSCYGGFKEGNTDENDYWVIKSDTKYVQTRISDLKFLHVKTGNYLGVKTSVTNKNDERHEVYSSGEGAKKYRSFIIEDNRIDEHHRNNTKDKRINDKIQNYDRLPFWEMFREYHMKLYFEKSNENKKNYNVSFKDIFNIRTKEKKYKFTEMNVNSILLLKAIFFPIIAIINKALDIRMKKSTKIPDEIYILFSIFALNLVFSIVKFKSSQIILSHFIGSLIGVFLLSKLGENVLIVSIAISVSNYLKYL
ncbi:hypothetical protein GVAV_001358 [Gurleya vavrai]